MKLKNVKKYFLIHYSNTHNREKVNFFFFHIQTIPTQMSNEILNYHNVMIPERDLILWAW